eukprot:116421-Hanusia_phi.AAC.1
MTRKTAGSLRLSKGRLYLHPENSSELDEDPATRCYDADKVKIKIEEDGGRNLVLAYAGESFRLDFESAEEVEAWSEALDQHGSYRKKEKQSISDRIPWKEMKEVNQLEDVGVKPAAYPTGLNFANVTFSRSVSQEGERRRAVVDAGGVTGFLAGEKFSESMQDRRELRFQVCTEQGGYNSGRTFIFRCSNEEEERGKVEVLKETAKRERKAAQRFNQWSLMQKRIKKTYSSVVCQGFIAILIVLNFLVNIVEKQINPEESSNGAALFNNLDIFFTVIFTVELLLNITANFFWNFVLDGWNIFDFIIITISILQLALSAIPAVRSLRTFRTFRIIRMFGKLKRLRTIINAIFASILPVLQTLAICLVVVAGEHLFRSPPFSLLVIVLVFQSVVRVVTSRQSIAVWVLSSSAASRREISVREAERDKKEGQGEEEAEERRRWRGRGRGEERRGAERRQWPDDTLPAFRPDGTVDVGTVAFIYSYVLIVVIVLLQVLVAVLLENFFTAARNEKAKIYEEFDKSEVSKLQNPLENLLGTLSVQFSTQEDLDERMEMLFRMFDKDRGGTLSFEELSEGLHRMFPQSNRLSEDEYFIFSGGHAELTAEQFREQLWKELKSHWLKKIADTAMMFDNEKEIETMLTTVKILMVMSDSSFNNLLDSGKEV